MKPAQSPRPTRNREIGMASLIPLGRPHSPTATSVSAEAQPGDAQCEELDLVCQQAATRPRMGAADRQEVRSSLSR